MNTEQLLTGEKELPPIEKVSFGEPVSGEEAPAPAEEA